jgi:chorismate dehydratase
LCRLLVGSEYFKPFDRKTTLPAQKFPLLYFSSPERKIHVRKIRISVVQYLNTAPLVWSFTRLPLASKYELSFTVPSLCAEALRQGAADIAIIPAIEYQRIEDLVVLPDMAIASKRRVRSLLLVSKSPVDQIKTLALDESSRSTQALTRILCHQHWRVAPELFEMPPDLSAMLQCADAAMLIGDPALRLSIAIEPHASRGLGGELICSGANAGFSGAKTLHVYDIVEEWRRVTGFPAVLAVWAARPHAVTPEVIEDFRGSLAAGLQHLDEISQHASRELDLPKAELLRYLSENIDFTLDAENLRGLDAYFGSAAALGLIPANKPVRSAGGDMFRPLQTAASVLANAKRS